MKFSDSGIIIGVRKYSESSLIVKVLSENHGLYSGFVRGGTTSPKNRAIYQNFNLVDFTWSAKIEDNLGFFKIELTKSFLAQIISSPIKLTALGILSVIIEENLQERESGEEIFPRLFELLKSLNLDDEIFLQKYIKFEIELLKILGYGIDLSSCAATGVVEDLYFVSPKSARAVCFSAGEEYRNKLLILPQFLLDEETAENKEDLINGLKLTGFFIDRFLTKVAKNRVLIENFSSRNQLLRMLESEK
ncbi:MAG: DNA repair protein RecO (recombination protein O) [Rickettsiales bacterium]|jgi:DNA repair protein RecO (recombination protein O)